MSLHHDLLAQAMQLAKLDPRRPKQANLRRAVSSSYYALFHLLTSEASKLYVTDAGWLAQINRTHNHAEMKKVSAMFANNKLPKALQSSSGAYAVPPELQNVASTFVNLQQVRHEADYDLIRTFTRQTVLDYVEQTQDAFSDWEKTKPTDYARLYLACFLLWKKWDEEPR